MTTPSPQTRRSARIAAVQALYQMEFSGASSAALIADLDAGRLPMDETEISAGEADAALFETIVEGAVAQQEAVDRAIARRLAKSWRLDRIDAVARAILRAGVTELWARGDIDTAVILDEYIEIAKSFLSDDEAGFINAALDACAKDIRSGQGVG